MNTDDFMDGQYDCMTGKQADMSRSADYQRGYNIQYQNEQNQTAISQLKERVSR
jgi:hypothetical protein